MKEDKIMMLKETDKIQIINYLNSHKAGYLSYNKMTQEINKKRCKPKDVLEFLIYYINDSLSKDKVNVKLVYKMLLGIEYHVRELPDLFTSELSMIVFSFYEKYIAYLEKHPEKKSEDILNSTEYLKEQMTKYIIKEPENNTYEVIEELEEILKKYQISFQDNQNLIQLLEKERKKNVKNKEIINSLKIVNKELKDKIEELKNSILQLNIIKEDNLKLEENNNYLKEELIKKQETITKQNDILASFTMEEENKRKKLWLKNKIIELLLINTYTLEELHQALLNGGINLSFLELEKILCEINQEIKIIDKQKITIPLTYHVCFPIVDEQTDFNIKLEKKIYSILLVSDFHLEKPEDLTKKFDELYNYAKKCNISLIINLGDFFDGYPYINHCDFVKYNLETRNLIDNVIKNFPYDSTIKQALLGGNHDSRLLYLGFEPFNYMANYRSDFIFLGYYASRLVFNDDFNSSFNLIHKHPKKYYRYQNMDIPDLIDDFYEKTNTSEVNTYMNFLGHFHHSLLNTKESYCVVPSYTYDQFTNGAWHITVYFNSMNKIDYLNFKSLTLTDKLNPTNEIIYQRIRKND